MMNKCYNIFIAFYKFSLWIYAFFNLKADEICKGQKNLLSNIINDTKNEKKIVWFHVSSLGEFEQGKSIISAYKKKYTSHKILLTVYSPSAYNIIKTNPIANWVFYLPHDTSKNAKLFISEVNPIKAFFIKYEFWYNYISELHKNNIPLYYISSVFRKEQYFFTFYGKWFAKQLKKITIFFVQDKESELILNNIDIKQVELVGDTRFESVKLIADQEYKNKKIEAFISNQNIIIAGSTWEKDEKIIKKIAESDTHYKWIIVPHELSNIQHLKKISKSVFLSKSTQESINNFNVLIIDEIGILSKLYRYANIAYIGGGFGKGIHNVIEAVIYNIPVIFGPNYHKSLEAKELLQLGIAKSVSNSLNLQNAIYYLNKKNVKNITEDYLKSKIGAVNKIMEMI